MPTDVTTQDLLITLRLANNRLQGVLPIGGWGEFLADVDLSNNNFEGCELAGRLGKGLRAGFL